MLTELKKNKAFTYKWRGIWAIKGLREGSCSGEENTFLIKCINKKSVISQYAGFFLILFRIVLCGGKKLIRFLSR